MQDLIFKEPYRFVPPIRGWRGRFWTAVCRRVLPIFLKREYGIVDRDFRHIDRLLASMDAGHGVLLLANHSRLADPLTLGDLTNATGGRLFYAMASFHLFRQNAFQGYFLPRIGAFSILREGVDNASLKFSIEALAIADRPLIIFPEGTVSRATDRLRPFLDGPATIGRMAARRRAKGDGGKVVMHPLTIRYEFLDDVVAAVTPRIEAIEKRLSIRPRPDLSLIERAARLGRGLLALKEVEYLGEARSGDAFERASRLSEELITPLEEKYETETGPGDDIVVRVKAVRTALAPMLLGAENDVETADRLDRELQQVYLSQQLVFYPRDYLAADSPPEHLLETVERFEEDLTDRLDVYGRFRVIVHVGEAIEIGHERPPKGQSDPLLVETAARINAAQSELAAEIAARRPGRETVADLPLV